LTNDDLRSLLVIGMDIVPLALSAKKAGYKVYGADYFGDQDLKRICVENQSILQQRAGISCGHLSDFNPKSLLPLARNLLRNHKIDAVLLSSGLDDSPEALRELNDLIPIMGNSPKVIEKVRDKTHFLQELKRLGIPHPETAVTKNLEEATQKAKEIGYPMVIKPSRGFGGAGVRKVNGPQEIRRAFREASLLDEDVLVQKFVTGTPASVTLISSKSGAVSLTVNEQLLGLQEVGQREPFGYCGNIVPLEASPATISNCMETARRVVSHFNLLGSNGVDMVVSQEGKSYVMEVNPRFQGTLECVEKVLGLNLVECHLKTCLQGLLSKDVRGPSHFCTRLISFAPQRSGAPNLEELKDIRDIPLPGVVIEEGEPLCSILTEGPTRSSSLKKAKRMANSISRLLQSAPQMG